MTSGLSGRLVLDTSALVELVFLTPEGLRLMQAMLDEEVEARATELGVTELRYLLCRRLGREEGKRTVDKLLASGYLLVEEITDILEDAARYKCERAISVADCFVLSLARKLDCRALFAYQEEELSKEMNRRPFDVSIIFLREDAATKA